MGPPQLFVRSFGAALLPRWKIRRDEVGLRGWTGMGRRGALAAGGAGRERVSGFAIKNICLVGRQEGKRGNEKERRGRREM